jgi:hypothetical protein
VGIGKLSLILMFFISSTRLVVGHPCFPSMSRSNVQLYIADKPSTVAQVQWKTANKKHWFHYPIVEHEEKACVFGGKWVQA